MSQYRNCQVGERYLTYACEFLTQSTGSIKVDQMSDLKTGKKLGSRVSVKRKGKVLLFNYCPFCGAPVLNLKSFEESTHG